jgi:hypothetical protein
MIIVLSAKSIDTIGRFYSNFIIDNSNWKLYSSMLLKPAKMINSFEINLAHFIG